MDTPGLPVPGYRPQSAEAIALVSEMKELEERILRRLDAMRDQEQFDQRWLAMGRTGIETALMAINRSVFRPCRVVLPGDTE